MEYIRQPVGEYHSLRAAVFGGDSPFIARVKLYDKMVNHQIYSGLYNGRQECQYMKKKLVLFRQLFVIGCLFFLCGTKLEAGAAQKQISDYIDVPAYQGEEAVEINDNEPFFAVPSRA